MSQHEAALPLDREVVDYVAAQVVAYVERTGYGSVVLLNDPKLWGKTVEKACRKACRRKNLRFSSLVAAAGDRKDFSTRLEMVLHKTLSGQP